MQGRSFKKLIGMKIVQILRNQGGMSHQLAATQAAICNLSRDEVVLDSLLRNVCIGGISNLCTASDLFDKDASKLDDAVKVRLLLRKLSPPDHERWIQGRIYPSSLFGLGSNLVVRMRNLQLWGQVSVWGPSGSITLHIVTKFPNVHLDILGIDLMDMFGHSRHVGDMYLDM